MANKRDKESLSDYVRRVRRAKGLTLRAISERAKRGGFKISHSTVSEVINEPGTSFGTETLKALAYGLGVPQEEVVNRAMGTVEENPSEYRRQLVEKLYDKMETDPPDKAKYTEALIIAVLGETENLGEARR